MAPLRFNQKNLQVLATQSSEKFHKEGILLFKEKEGKLFTKSEVFTERFFRLYGNLLLYFKGVDQGTELSGIIVLENFILTPDQSASRNFTFTIEFENGDEQKYEFAAKNQKDYTEWLAIIKSSSYEKMRQKLDSLRTQILQITGVDPLTNGVTEECLQEEPKSNEDVLMEMCLGCKNLTGDGLHPMIRISASSPPETEWVKLSQTDISEEGCNPNFLRTILLSKRFNTITRLKFVVYNVINRSKSDVVVIGQSICTIQEIQNAPNWNLVMSIRNIDSVVGNLIIQGWQVG